MGYSNGAFANAPYGSEAVPFPNPGGQRKRACGFEVVLTVFEKFFC